MSIVLKINDVDRTEYVEKDSFGYENIANDEVDNFIMTLKVNQTNLSTIKPDYNDKVELTHNGTLIFGGTIQSIKESEIGFNVYHIHCEVKDYSHGFTKKRVADAFENVTDLYVLNNLINQYANLDAKIIDGLETGWSGGTADTDHFVEGDQAIKISNATITKAVTLDLTAFSSGIASTTDDFIDFWYFIDDEADLTSIYIRLGDTGLSNYYGYTVSSGFSTGWNYFHIAKSAFTSSGSPDWDDLDEVALNATGTADVSFDDIRMISATTGHDKSNIDVDNITYVAYLPFNYLPLFQAIQDLAGLTGKYWYVDENRSVHYFSPGFEEAPFIINDTNGNMIKKTLVVDEDGTELKNIVYVRGGTFLASARNVQTELGDGEKRSWQLDYKGQDLRVFVDTGSGFVEETVGLDNIDEDDGTYDWFWNNSEKIVKQATAGTTLAATDSIKIDMFPYLPVLVQVRDVASVSEYGDNEMLIIDKNIRTKQGAQERGLAEVRAFREALVDGSFMTLTDGLRAGMELNVNSAKRGLNRNFIIWSVSASMHTEDDFVYNVQLISKRKLTLANTLIQLLLEKTREIEVDDNEVIDILKPHSESVLVEETHTEDMNTAVAAKWGAHAEQGTYTTYYKYS